MWAAVWLGLVAGITGGAVIFAVAGWSRTRSAFPAFERFAPSGDAAVADNAPQPGDADVLDRIGRETGATASLVIADVPIVLYRPDGTGVAIDAVVNPVAPAGTVDRGYLVAGRWPDPLRADQIAVNELTAADWHLEPGSTLRVGLFAASQSGGSGQGQPTPLLGDVPMTVTAVVRYTADLEQRPDARPGTQFATDGEFVELSRGVWNRYGSRTALSFMGEAVRLPDGPSGFSRLANATQVLSGGRFDVSLGDNFVPNRSALVRTIDLQAGALLAVGILGALVAAIILGQSIARHVTRRTTEQTCLGALGMTSRQIVAAEVLTFAPAAVGAAALAAAVAIVLSPLAPVGIARDAELRPGVQIDWVVVSIGAVVVGAFVVSVAARAAWLSRRPRPVRSPRRNPLPARLGAAGAPAPVVAGADLALSSSAAGTAVVRPALAMLAIGVVVVVGAWVVRASLIDLLDTPARRGWAWDAQVGDITSPSGAAEATRLLDADPDVAGYAGVLGGVDLPIDGRPTPVTILDMHGAVVGPIMIDGRAPASSDEVALGPSSLRDLHKHLGDMVQVDAPGGAAIQLRIVGTIVPASSLDTLESFGRGALVPFSTAQGASGPDNPLVPSFYVVTLRPDANRVDALARLDQLFPRTVLIAPSSVDVDTLRRVDWLPVVLAGLVGVLTAGTLAHLVLTSVNRRRRDLGVLRALGFTTRQTVAVVMSMSVIVAVAVVVIGVPLGVVAGRLTWTAVADGLGTVAGPQVPALLVVVVPATVAVALAAAAWPARRAVGPSVARTLRAE